MSTDFSAFCLRDEIADSLVPAGESAACNEVAVIPRKQRNSRNRALSAFKNTKNVKGLWTSGLFLCSTMVCTVQAGPATLSEAGGDPLRIAATLDHSVPGGIPIRFRVTNVSDRTIELQDNYLPWGDGSSLDLYVVEEGARPRVHAALPFMGQVAPTKVTLSPGGEVAGLVDLAQRFPDAQRLLKKEVVIVWIWNASRLARIGGPVIEDKIGGIRVRSTQVSREGSTRN